MDECLFWLKIMYFFEVRTVRVGGAKQIDGALRYCEWDEEVARW